MSKKKKIDYSKDIANFAIKWLKENPGKMVGLTSEDALIPDGHKSSTAGINLNTSSQSPANTISHYLAPADTLSQAWEATKRAKLDGMQPSLNIGYKPSLTEQNLNVQGIGVGEVPIYPEQTITAQRSNIPLRDIQLTEQQRKIGMNIPLPNQEDVYSEERQRLGNVLNVLSSTIERPLQNIIAPIAEGERLIGQGLMTKTIPGNYMSLVRPSAQILAGGMKTALGSLPPVAALNAIQPFIVSAAGSIADKIGADRQAAEDVTNKITPFIFGLPVGIGSLASEEVVKGLENLGAFNRLSEQDKVLAKELIQNGLFFGIAGFGGKIKHKITDYLQNTREVKNGKHADAKITEPKINQSKIEEAQKEEIEPTGSNVYEQSQQIYGGEEARNREQDVNVSDLLPLEEKQNASRIQSTEQIPEHEVRTQVGEETRLRQQPEELTGTRQEKEVQGGEKAQNDKQNVKPGEIDNNRNAAYNMFERGKSIDDVTAMLKIPKKEASNYQREFKAKQSTARVISTAVWRGKGYIAGDKPFDSHDAIAEQWGIKAPEGLRGFVVEENGKQRFVHRSVAAKIAYKAGQIEKPVKELHSENLRKGQLGVETILPEQQYTPAQYLSEAPTTEVIRQAIERFGGAENLQKAFEKEMPESIQKSEIEKGIDLESFARKTLAEDALQKRKIETIFEQPQKQKALFEEAAMPSLEDVRTEKVNLTKEIKETGKTIETPSVKKEGGTSVTLPEERSPRKRLISDGSYEEAKKRLSAYKGKLYDIGGAIGESTEFLKDVAIIGGYHLESGLRDFGMWSKKMVEELGENIKPHLQDIWNNIRGVPEESKKVFGVKKSLLDDSEINTTMKRDFPNIVEGGRRLYNEGKINDDFVKQLMEHPRALQPEETVAFGYYSVDLSSKIDDLSLKLSEARKSGDVEQVNGLLNDLVKANQENKNFQEMANATNYEKGLSLVANKLVFQNQYSVDKSINEIVSSLGDRELTGEQKLAYQEKYGKIINDLKRSHDNYIEADKVFELKKKNEELENTIANLKVRAGREGLKARRLKRAESVEQIKQHRSDLYKQLFQETGALAVNPFANPKSYRLLGSIAYDYIKEGVIKAEDIVDRIYQDVKDKYEGITKRDISDALSGYGRITFQTKDEIQTQLNNVRRLLKLNSQYEDALKGIAPNKSKTKRVTPEEIKLARQRVNNELRRQGLKVDITDDSKRQALRTRYANAEKELQRRIDEKDFTEVPRRKLPLDEATIKAKEIYEKKKQEYETELRKDKLANRTTYEKILDGVVSYKRFDVLSSPKSILKIFNALTIESLGAKPLSILIAKGLVKVPVISKVAERAMIWSDPQFKDLIPFYKYEFSGRALQNFMKIMKGEKADTDLRLGKGDYQAEDVSGFGRFTGTPGRIHGSEKSIPRIGATEMAENKITESMLRQGVNPESLENQALRTKLATDFGNWTILMEDNYLVNKVNGELRALRNSKSNSVKALGAFFRSLLPVMKIPTNYAKRTATYGGGGIANAIATISKGIESLTPEQADKVIRNLTIGTIGTAEIMIGYFSPNVFGGYYQPGEKRGEEDVGFSGIKGLDWFGKILHHPAMEGFQIGSTIRRVLDKAGEKELSTPEAVFKALHSTARGVITMSPLTENPVGVAIQSSGGAKKFIGDEAKTFIDPLFIQNIASWTDVDEKGNLVKRKPKGGLPEYLWQSIESGIPGLRQNVPEIDKTTLERSGLQESQEIKEIKLQEKRVKLLKDSLLNEEDKSKIEEKQKRYNNAKTKLDTMRKNSNDYKKLQRFEKEERKRTNENLGKKKLKRTVY